MTRGRRNVGHAPPNLHRDTLVRPVTEGWNRDEATPLEPQPRSMAISEAHLCGKCVSRYIRQRDQKIKLRKRRAITLTVYPLSSGRNRPAEHTLNLLSDPSTCRVTYFISGMQ